MYNFICMLSNRSAKQSPRETHGSLFTLTPAPSFTLAYSPEITSTLTLKAGMKCDQRPAFPSTGMVITLGGVHKFRFNHPAEAAILRERRRVHDPQLPFMLILDTISAINLFFLYIF